jgi:hypothetical protein
MIVVGTSGERPLLGIVLGPTPSKLLHRATVPVLVIPPRLTPAWGASRGGPLGDASGDGRIGVWTCL